MDATNSGSGTRLLARPKTMPVGVWAPERQPAHWVANTGVIALVVVLGFGAFAQLARSMLFTPDDAVHHYFAALAARDPTELGNTDGRGDLITDAAYTPPTAVLVERVQRFGDSAAAVDVSFESGGSRWHTTIGAVRTGWWGPWSPTAPTSALDPVWPKDVTGLSATIGGQALEAGSLLHPGAYTVSATSTDAFAPTRTATIIVTGSGDTLAVTVPVAPRPELAPRLTAVVDRFLDDCVKGASRTSLVAGEGCPLRYDGTALFPKNIAWRIDSYPTVSIVVGDLEPLQVATTTPGAATVTYTQGHEAKTQHVKIRIPGWVTVDQGKLTWHRDNLSEVTE